jgi:hypothetical protein
MSLRIGFAVSLFLAVPITSAAQEATCSTPINVQGQTVQTCEDHGLSFMDEVRLGDCVQSSAWMEAVAAATSECVRALMVEALDDRLQPLKEENKKQVALETKLQKSFNDAVTRQCGYFRGCKSEGAPLAAAECPRKFFAYRLAQLEAMNAGTLEMGYGEAEGEKADAFLAYAKAICALPGTVWNGEKTPSHCVDRVVFDLEKSVMPLSTKICDDDPKEDAQEELAGDATSEPAGEKKPELARDTTP